MKLTLDEIICGDNVETMAGFPADSIDLVVTSPPYDNLRTYGTNGDMSELWNFEALAAQLWRVIKPGGVVVWVVGDATVDGSETGTSFRQALHFKEIGFRLHDTMIWTKRSRHFQSQIDIIQLLNICLFFAKVHQLHSIAIKDRTKKFSKKQSQRRQRRDKSEGKTEKYNPILQR